MEQRNYGSQGFATQPEQDSTSGTIDNIADQAKKAGAKAQQYAHDAADKASQVVDDLKSKDAGQIVDDAKQKAADVGAAVSDKVDSAMTATGEQFSNLAQTVRENAPEGKVGDIATSAADALDRSGSYLQQADLQAVRTDLEQIIRDHPIETLLVGLGVGYLLARASRR